MIDTVARLVNDEAPTLNGLREADIRTEMERILRSRAFVHSHRIRRFLQFVVEECLLGQHHRLKEYLIGLEVFNRQEAFDPRVDSIVRVEARRLRTKLEEYYLSEGQEDEIRIQLRKGSYVPAFEHRRPGMMSQAAFGAAHPRRAVGVGAFTVFNGAADDPAIEEVRRRVAHVLIKEGYFRVTTGPAASGVAEVTASLAMGGLGEAFGVDGAGDGAKSETAKADYAVDGSLHFNADRVNVILQLLNSGEGSYIWSEQVDCRLNDLTPVEDLARNLNRALVTTAASADAARARRQGVNRESYDHYLRGRYNWKIGTPESIRNSVPMFTKALEHDPGYAAAWAALAEALLMSSVFGYVDSAASAARMKEAAEQAAALNENLPEAHVARGAVSSILDWDWATGERELQRAIQLAPNDSSAHVCYGILLACRRMLDVAVSQVECALEMDPASLFTNFVLGWLYTAGGRYDEAIAQHRLVARLAPDFPLSYLGLGWAHMGKESYRDAIAQFTNATNLLKTRTLVSGCLGYCYARSNDKEEALRQLLLLDNESHDGDRRHQPWPVSAAAIYAGLGDKGRALTYLEEAVASHNAAAPLRTLNPEFNSLRTEPRFQEALRKMGVG